MTMSIPRRALVALLLAATLALPLLAIPASAQRPQTISIWFPLPTGGPLKEAMDELVSRFNASHGDLRVSLELTGDYWQNYQKIQTAVVAGSPPDAAMMELMQIPEFADAGILAPLDDFAKQRDFNFADVAPALLGNSYWKGKLYAIPWQRSTTMMYYNVDAFRDAGLPEFSPPATWDEFRRIAPRLVQKQGDQVMRYAMEGNFNHDWLYEGLVYSFGGRVVSEDGRRAMFNQAPGVTALTLLRDLSKRDRVMYVNPNFSGIIENFIAGRSAMIVHSSFAIALITNRARFRWSVAPIPAGPSGSVHNAGGGNFVIFAKTSPERQRAAWEFVKWMTAPANTAFYSMRSGYIPVRTSAMEDAQLKTYFRQFPMARKSIELSLTNGKGRMVVLDVEKGVRQFLVPALEAALLGNADPKQALDEAAAKANAVLGAK
jgi:sn-glycerol 3-phosphate transport system substrate-binding protein